MNKLLIISILLLAFGCQTTRDNGMKRRNLGRYYVSSGIERFFMGDIPQWVNVSRSGSCKRQSEIKFINLPKLQNNFQLNYRDAIQFQYYLNLERHSKMEFYNSEFLMLKDEEIIFYDVSDRIQSGIFAFKSPKFKRVNLVWIDPVLDSKEKMNDLVRLMRSKSMDLGHPVFISLCMDHRALKRFINSKKVFGDNILMIPFDMFSVFDSEKKQQLGFQLEVERLLRKDQDIHLYIPAKEAPSEFIGKFKIHNY
ncbi:MAG: hypothetical protein KAG61_03430 [Bacteriovoracaceae bacterium]|nr:hypothetical protein [Bacteriovoracaceae bacterium]